MAPHTSGTQNPTPWQPWPCSSPILLPSSCCGRAHDENSSGAAGAGPALGEMHTEKELAPHSPFPSALTDDLAVRASMPP